MSKQLLVVNNKKKDLGHDKSTTQEARSFLTRNQSSPYSIRAPSFSPCLGEIQDSSFSDYVRKVLFQTPSTTNANRQQGLAKVTLPAGFSTTCKEMDTSGRGLDWQEGGKYGNLQIQNPIKQCLDGIGGVYEYTLLDQDSCTLHEFRAKADAYQQAQIGNIVTSSQNLSDDECDALATKFWKRCGPTMEPSMYGADMEGTLFQEGDDASGWNLGQLESCLQLLSADTDGRSLPGVTTPYLYFGMWASVFCAHTEDMNLLSINYLHAGAPKYWYAISADNAKRFESLAESRFIHASRDCKEFLRHKRYLLSPAILKKAGVAYTTQIQRPGDAILTMPGSYHFGINLGFNVAEATNFAIPEWIPFGQQARICMCRPDSVRIDMKRFQELLEKYEDNVANAERLGLPPLSFRQWTIVEANCRIQQEQEEAAKKKRRNSTKKKNDIYLSSEEVVDDQIKVGAKKRRQFVIEVTKPVSASREATMIKKKKGNKRQKKSKKNVVKEEWRIAKPGTARSLTVSRKVLVLLPGTVIATSQDGNESVTDEEQCFAGEITEVADDCVRVHFAGLTKKEDVWIKQDSPKIFLDGGIKHYD